MRSFNSWGEGGEGLIFKVNNILLAFPLLDIVEIKPDNRITKIPGYPYEVLGSSLIRQELITILSVNRILKQTEKDEKIDIIAMIRDGRKFGFRVEEIVGTETISKEMIKKGNFSDYCIGYADIKGQLISLTTPQFLFQSLISRYE